MEQIEHGEASVDSITSLNFKGEIGSVMIADKERNKLFCRAALALLR